MTEVTRVRRASFKLFPERGCHMAALLFLFLLGEHSWFAFSNLKEKHPLSFLRRKDGGRISSGCQPCGRRHLSRAPRPMPGGRGWQPAGCTRNGCAALHILEICHPFFCNLQPRSYLLDTTAMPAPIRIDGIQPGTGPPTADGRHRVQPLGTNDASRWARNQTKSTPSFSP